jgi:hypothetical protein
MKFSSCNRPGSAIALNAGRERLGIVPSETGLQHGSAASGALSFIDMDGY